MQTDRERHTHTDRLHSYRTPLREFSHTDVISDDARTEVERYGETKVGYYIIL